MESVIFQTVGASINAGITAFIVPGAANLTTALQTATLAFVTLYIMVMGFGIALGSINAPITKFAVQALKIVIITSFVISGAVYGPLIVGGIQSLELLLASALNGSDADSIYTVIDNTLGSGIALAMVCFDNVSTGFASFSVTWGLAGLLVIGGTVAIVLLGGASIIAAKLLLAVVFAIGPFFILMLMFPLTAKFFDSWFSLALNYTLVVVVVSVVMSFAMVIFEAIISGADLTSGGDTNPLLVGVEVFIMSFVMVFILQQSQGLAASLAGGFSMSVLTYAHMLTPARMTRNLIDPQSSRRDTQSGMQVTARRHEHLLAGNTMINPAYRQQFKENMMKHWGMSKGGEMKNDR